jgi:hypothetical protein
MINLRSSRENKKIYKRYTLRKNNKICIQITKRD